MNAAIPLGSCDSAAVGAPFGFVCAEDLARDDGRAIVILHQLGAEKEREFYGPRELRDATCAQLARIGWPEKWGLGGVCREPEDAANFALAGYTWFTFDIASHVYERADAASLDELDAGIVALEDAGVFSAGWHKQYLASFDEEKLARAAVKFGRALTLAEDLQQAMRTAWSGRGTMPDVEIHIARLLRKTTATETRFIAMELLRRGIWASVFAPSLGLEFQPGLCPSTSPEVGGLAAILKASGDLRLAAHGASHTDTCDRAFFAMLTRIIENYPTLFRAILATAREAFPMESSSWNVLVMEDDVRMMPEVEDDQLADTFLRHPHGRQLLLCTWDAVCEKLGGRIRAAF